MMRRLSFLTFAVPIFGAAAGFGLMSASAGSAPGVGVVPQGRQADSSYASSYKRAHVTNVDATTQKISCYTPEVPYFSSLAPNEGYSGMSACGGASTTGENLGPYATQAGSNSGFPAVTPMLVKDHSESDIRVDPTNPSHLMATAKWVVSPEGYNHLLGFYESWDRGSTWPVQGHIPGYEGWTDNTDPVGAFDRFGDYYQINLPYQFFYDGDTHDFQTGRAEPNPTLPNEVISMSVLPAAVQHDPNGWVATVNGKPDYIATYDSNANGNGPDKEWMTIDTNPKSPFVDTIYAMWVDFHFATPVPFVSTATALPGGTHTAWSTPVELPSPPHNPQGVTYLLPHVDGNGVVYTPLTNFLTAKGHCCAQIFVDKSTDGGATWSVAGIVNENISPPPLEYANTQFRDGIETTFTVGQQPIHGSDPLFVSYEDFSAGFGNVIVTASYDGGSTWTNFEQVNDNASPTIDAFQPNLTAAANGTISVAFYDRRLACPAAGTANAAAAGLAKDTRNLNFSGALPPYAATNYCVNATIQFYDELLNPIGNNIRISQHTWDPQLNEPLPSNINGVEGFIGDYYGNIAAGSVDYTTSVSTYDDGTNPSNQQEQIVAAVAIP